MDCISRKKSNTDVSSSTQSVKKLIPTDRIWLKSRRSSYKDSVSKSIVKLEYYRTILIAKPNHVKFHNFKSKTLYKKTISLQNTSTTLGTFQIGPRPSGSKFIVMIESKRNYGKHIIPPGMKLRLFVFFYNDISEEIEEQLLINVQQGRPVAVKLHAFNDSPILNCFLQPIPSPPLTLTPLIPEKHGSIQIVRYKDSFIRRSSHDYRLKTNSTIAKDTSIVLWTWDCGTCFFGEQIKLKIEFQNVGTEGKFAIISENDWNSMHIKDITCTNTLILPSFAIEPIYFSLKSNEKIHLNTYFVPSSTGLNVDHLYVISDNCSVKQIEIVGDGVIYDSYFFKFDKNLKRRLSSEESLDNSSIFYLNMGQDEYNGVIKKKMSIINTSDIPVAYRWEKLKNRFTLENKQNLHSKLINVQPSSGVFPPSSAIYFNIDVQTGDLESNIYIATLRFYIEDIPCAAIPDHFQVSIIEECKTRERKCFSSVDIGVIDIEFEIDRIINVDRRYRMFDLDSNESCQSSSTLFSNETNDQTTFNQIFEELDSHHDATVLKVIRNVVETAILKPGRSLSVGTEEIYTLIVMNKSHKTLIYNWGNPEGSDMSKLKVSIYPNKDELLSGDVKRIHISCLPMEMGIVKSFDIPCYIGSSLNVIMLTIECSVEDFFVTFHLPITNQTISMSTMNWINMRWGPGEVPGVISLHDMSTIRKVTGIHEFTEEERELLNVNLDNDPPVGNIPGSNKSS